MAVNWQVKHHHHATVCGRMFSTIGSTSSEFHDIKREDLTVYPPYCKQQSFLTHTIVRTEHTLTLLIGTQMTTDHANQACYCQKNTVFCLRESNIILDDINIGRRIP